MVTLENSKHKGIIKHIVDRRVLRITNKNVNYLIQLTRGFVDILWKHLNRIVILKHKS